MREPDKMRFLRAARHVSQEEIPLFEIEADPAIVSQMLGKRVDMGLHSFELAIPDVVEWNRRMGNDMVYISHVWHLGRRETRDDQGRVHYIDGMLKTRASFADIALPDLGGLRCRLDELFEALEGTGFGVVYGAQMPGHIAATAIGYEDFCINTILDPELIREFQSRILDYVMQELDLFLSYPIDVVKLGSGLITSTGPMISPEMLEQFDLTFMRQQIRLIRECGRLVMLHVDGDTRSMLPTFIDMGIDILNPIEPIPGKHDIYELKAQVGDRLALCGNIDINGVLLHGTPEEVHEDVRAHIDELAVGGGYIVASSHDLHQLLPVVNIHAMRDAVHTHRFRPL